MPTVLHVGAGTCPVHPFFKDHKEIRLDLDPDCNPDIVGPMDNIPLHDMSVDAIYTSHALEHVPHHQAIETLKEFRRVLVPDGVAVVVVPDVSVAALAVAEGDPYRHMYDSPSGPVCAADMIWGHKDWMARFPEKAYRWAHCFGYTPRTLGQALAEAGFHNIRIDSVEWNAIAVGEA